MSRMNVNRTLIHVRKNFSSSLYRSGQRNPSVQLHEIVLKPTQQSVAFTREGDASSDLVFVALHGGPGSHNDFKYLAETLKSSMTDVHPYQLLRFDLPGYGKSDRFASNPTSENFSSSILDTLTELKILDDTTKKYELSNNKKVVVIGHSLGGHIAVNISAQAPQSVSGIILLSSVSCRPHKALGNENGYKLAKWFGLNADNKVYGFVIRAYLHFLYKYVLGFPKHVKKDEIVWTSQRVAHLNWNQFASQVKSITCPVMFAYATDDKLFEAAVFRELADALKSRKQPSSGGNAIVSTIFEYQDGGHNIQKTKAAELGAEIKNWLLKNIL